jgi:putative phosphoribosyl transferase
MFKDRYDAATKLAAKLIKYKGQKGIVYAIPRGGVPIGYVISKHLDFPLEILLSKKIGYPGHSEYAIGSVTLQGTIVNKAVPHISEEYIQAESSRILEELKKKHHYFTGNGNISEPDHKIVILADDGIATGNTIIAAAQALKQHHPAKIIAAVPVAPPESILILEGYVDEVVCLETPFVFYAVSQFYEKFSQVSDEEVKELIADASKNAGIEH